MASRWASARCPDGSLDYLYVRGELLVRDEYLDQVQSLIRGTVTDGFQDGVTLLTVDSRGNREVDDSAQADRPAGSAWETATPNHLPVRLPHTHLCPATEPEAVPADAAPLPSFGPSGGSGVSIYVVDTGLLADAGSHRWLAGVTVRRRSWPRGRTARWRSRPTPGTARSSRGWRAVSRPTPPCT